MGKTQCRWRGLEDLFPRREAVRGGFGAWPPMGKTDRIVGITWGKNGDNSGTNGDNSLPMRNWQYPAEASFPHSSSSYPHVFPINCRVIPILSPFSNRCTQSLTQGFLCEIGGAGPSIPAFSHSSTGGHRSFAHVAVLELAAAAAGTGIIPSRLGRAASLHRCRLGAVLSVQVDAVKGGLSPDHRLCNL